MFSVDFVPKQQLSELETEELVTYLVNKVKDCSILVIEEGLDHHQEMSIIEETMANIDHKRFSGVKMVTFETNKTADRGGGIFGRKPTTTAGRYTILAPSGLVNILQSAGGRVSIRVTPQSESMELAE